MLKSKLPSVACVVLGLVTAAAAQTVKTQINFPQPVAGVAVNPFTDLIYVVEPSFGGPNDTLAVVSGKTDQVIANISVPVGAYLPAVDWLTNKIYIASCNTSEDPTPCFVTVVDGRKNEVVHQIPITSNPGNGLLGITVDPFRDSVYVANASDGVVDIISGRTHTIISELSTSEGTPTGLVVNPFNQLLYVPLGNSTIDIFNLRKKEVREVTFGTATSFAAVNLSTNNLYVTDSVIGPSTVGVFDRSGTAITSVPVGDTPYGLDVDPFTNLVFVSSTALNEITAINGKTNTVTSTVSGVPATFVAVNPVTEKVYVTGGNSLTVLTEK
ncbi:MAG TPA: YncE family protein [Pseudacidobacterium sp.]|jgi:DNA-binding beta-propeller fold protein YncE|nr:YncE family protein [Pseudacidobacterium sp.]